MRRLGMEAWAGLAMLTVAIAVAGPVLFGAADPSIPRGAWLALFALLLVSLVGSFAAEGAPLVRRAGFVVAIVASWAVVLTAPGMGLLLILLVVTAASSVYLVPMWVGYVVVGLNTAVVVASASGAESSRAEAVTVAGFYLLIQLASLLSTATLLREQQMRRELAEAHVELRAASILLSESARTEERLRISRELHDLIGHQLTVLTLELETARHREDAGVREHLDRADRVARDLLHDVRTTVGQLRTKPPDLEEALRRLTDAIPGLDVVVDVSPRVEVGEEGAAALVRATQEIVTNTLRHAEASTLSIEIDDDGDDVVLRAHDDGRGAPDVVLGNGLLGLRERFAALGGQLTFDGTEGFAVTARVPAS